MDSKLVSVSVEVSSALPAAGGTRPRLPWLFVARTAWAVIFLLALIVFTLSVSLIYINENLPCAARDWPACGAFGDALHQLGLSWEFYGLYFLTLQTITGL